MGRYPLPWALTLSQREIRTTICYLVWILRPLNKEKPLEELLSKKIEQYFYIAPGPRQDTLSYLSKTYYKIQIQN
jgi:hypothetical protein